LLDEEIYTALGVGFVQNLLVQKGFFDGRKSAGMRAYRPNIGG